MIDPQVALFLAASGLAAGFIDSIAGGGGLITVPALLAVGLPPQIALGTNKLQSICGTAIATYHYGRAGLFSWHRLRLALLITALAATLGALAVLLVPPGFLRQIIPWLLIAIAIYFWSQPQLGLSARTPKIAPPLFAWLAGSTLGFYDGFFGPGVGAFWMLACVLLAGLDLRSAVGHTKAMNLASNAGSLIVFLAAGQVRLDFAATMIVGQLLGAKLGSRLVIKNGTKFIRPIFLTVVILLAARLLWPRSP
ncbi:MAG: TSUP family transporter [Verrucomicrobiota bacterium]